MNRWLLLLFVICSYASIAQQPAVYLHIKKGYKKVRTYQVGDPIILENSDRQIIRGQIEMLRDSTILIREHAIKLKKIKKVWLPVKRKQGYTPDLKTLALVTAGVGLVTGGLSLSKQATTKEALTAGLVLGYGPIGLMMVRSRLNFKRKKYKIGKKFYLQIYDLTLHPKAF